MPTAWVEGRWRSSKAGQLWPQKGTASPGTESELLSLPWRPVRFYLRCLPPQSTVAVAARSSPGTQPLLCLHTSAHAVPLPGMLVPSCLHLTRPRYSAQLNSCRFLALVPKPGGYRPVWEPLAVSRMVSCPRLGLPHKVAQVACTLSISQTTIHTDDEGLLPTWIRVRLTSLPTRAYGGLRGHSLTMYRGCRGRRGLLKLLLICAMVAIPSTLDLLHWISFFYNPFPFLFYPIFFQPKPQSGAPHLSPLPSTLLSPSWLCLSLLCLFLACQGGLSVPLSYSCPLSTGSPLSHLFLSLFAFSHLHECLSLSSVCLLLHFTHSPHSQCVSTECWASGQTLRIQR